MTFYKTDCPECCERILLDVINGYGYCMYCGAKVEPQDLIPIQNTLREAISIEINKDDVSNPWSKPLAESIGMAQSGDIDGCIKGLRDILEKTDKNKMDEVVDDIDKSIVDWIISGISDDNLPSYNGGAKEIYEGIRDLVGDGMNNMIINICQMHLAVISTNINNPDKAKRLITTAFMLFNDKVDDFSNLDELMEFLTAIHPSCRNVINMAYPDAGNDEKYSEEMPFRYYNFLSHLIFVLSNETRGLKRKELIKINRQVSAMDNTEAVMNIRKAMDSLSDNPDDYFGPMIQYVSFILGGTLKNKKKA